MLMMKIYCIDGITLLQTIRTKQLDSKVLILKIHMPMGLNVMLMNS